jgi:nucleolar protein 56
MTGIMMNSNDSCCSLILLEIGLAAFDKKDNLIVSRRFDNAIHSYYMLKSGEIPEEVQQILEKLNYCDCVYVNDNNISSYLSGSGFNAKLMSQEKMHEIQNGKATLIVKSGLADNETDAIQELRDFAIELSSSRVKQASEKLDLHIIQSVNSLDELDKIINVMGARMREWYGLHFPELDHLVQNINSYAEIVSKAGSRDKINTELLTNIVGIQDRKIEIIMEAANRSKGGDITSTNLEIVKKLADEVISLSKLRKILSDHLEDTMETVAPNIKGLLTASLGARIIAKAGSLNRLCLLPASTIQILGAEKALFRSLKTGARPPKHGLLFQHSLIHSAPRWQRGKISRAIASKVAIAARIDLYRHGTGRDLSIVNRLNSRISEIQEKYKEASSSQQERVQDKKFKWSQSERRQQQYYHPYQREVSTFRRKDKETRNRKGKRKKDKKRFGRRRY